MVTRRVPCRARSLSASHPPLKRSLITSTLALRASGPDKLEPAPSKTRAGQVSRGQPRLLRSVARGFVRALRTLKLLTALAARSSGAYISAFAAAWVGECLRAGSKLFEALSTREEGVTSSRYTEASGGVRKVEDTTEELKMLAFSSGNAVFGGGRGVKHSANCESSGTLRVRKGRGGAARVVGWESKREGSAVSTEKKEAPLSDEDRAEATRRALTASTPLRRKKALRAMNVDPEKFEYTSGVSSGVDVWLISALLCFIVPAVFLGIFIANGYIDLTPR